MFLIGFSVDGNRKKGRGGNLRFGAAETEKALRKASFDVKDASTKKEPLYNRIRNQTTNSGHEDCSTVRFTDRGGDERGNTFRLVSRK